MAGRVTGVGGKLPLSDCECPRCRTHHLRDWNAAKNVRAAGLRIVAEGHPETVNAVGTVKAKARRWPA